MTFWEMTTASTCCQVKQFGEIRRHCHVRYAHRLLHGSDPPTYLGMQTTAELLDTAGDLVKVDGFLLAAAFHDVHGHGRCSIFRVGCKKERRGEK